MRKYPLEWNGIKLKRPSRIAIENAILHTAVTRCTISEYKAVEAYIPFCSNETIDALHKQYILLGDGRALRWHLKRTKELEKLRNE